MNPSRKVPTNIATEIQVIVSPSSMATEFSYKFAESHFMSADQIVLKTESLLSLFHRNFICLLQETETDGAAGFHVAPPSPCPSSRRTSFTATASLHRPSHRTKDQQPVVAHLPPLNKGWGLTAPHSVSLCAMVRGITVSSLRRFQNRSLFPVNLCHIVVPRILIYLNPGRLR